MKRNHFSKSSTIKVKLILAFFLTLVIPAVSIGSISYFIAKNAVKHEMINGFSETINVLNESMGHTLQPKIHDIDSFSKTVTSQQYKRESSPELRKKLAQYVQLHPESYSIFVGTDSGAVIQEPNLPQPSGYDPRERPWYKEAMENKGEVVISDPYLAAGTEDMIITISQATEDKSGVMGIDITIGSIQELTKQVKIGEKGYAILLDKNKKYVSHPTIKAGDEAIEDFYNNLYMDKNGQFEYTYNGHDKIMVFDTNPLTGWKIGGTVESSEISKAASPIFRNTIIVIMIAMIIGIIIISIMIKSITKPINELKEKAHTFSKGDLTEDIHINSKDEIGDLAYSFNNMAQSLRKIIQQINTSSEHVAASSQELQATSEQATMSTEQIAFAIQEVASGSETQVASSRESAAAMDEVAAGIQRIAEFSATVGVSAQEATTLSEQGNQSLQEAIRQMESIENGTQNTTTAIKKLNEQSHEIGKIVSVITDIANQTNLLALNAAIEAARAGEHGKGFAVVADEVRKLAEESKTSADQIIALIQEIQKDTESVNHEINGNINEVNTGKEIILKTSEAFQQALKAVENVNVQIQEISATSEQISANTEEVAATVEQLAQIAKAASGESQNIASSSEEQLASMEEIHASSEALSKLAQELQEIVATFKV